jgi:hypothetical protein
VPVGGVKAVSDTYQQKSLECEYEKHGYTMSLDQIVVKGAGAVSIKVVPKLQSRDEYPKTESEASGSSSDVKPIVL